MKSDQKGPSGLLKRVTVIIRSAGERTEEACHALIKEQGIPPEALFVVKERPFSKALRFASELAIREGRRWTYFIDADVLLRSGAIERMVRLGESQPLKVVEIQGYCLDKFFGGRRPAGNHLYRTANLPELISSIPDEGKDLRPETYALNVLKSKGLEWVTVPYLVGLHGFEQSFQDIFRTSFVQAHKHQHFEAMLIPFWREHAATDKDYQAALMGFGSGVKHFRSVRIDKDASYFADSLTKMNFSEKRDLIVSDFSLKWVDATIRAWKEPAAHWQWFPEGMVSSNKGLVGRSLNLWRVQLVRAGVVKGTLAGIGFGLQFLSRKILSISEAPEVNPMENREIPYRAANARSHMSFRLRTAQVSTKKAAQALSPQAGGGSP